MLTAASSLALGSSAKLRIAIMGTGLAGSTVASVLAQKADVTIFEAGRAPGGRSSTRRSREVSYVFDHGLQYISRPKSREFTEVLDEWLACGCVARWEPRTAIVDLPIQSSPQVFEDAEKGVGFVGNPSSDSIVKFQLEKAEGVKTKFNCRTNAHFLEESQTWKLVSDTTGEDLGEFDWLVTGDRLSAAPWRKDFASDSATQNATAEFRALAGTVSSDPCLVIMVAFDRHVAFPGVNSLLFKNSPKLAWAARDSSKPGRGRQDDHECWVVQSTSNLAEEVIAAESDASAVALKAANILLPEFTATLKEMGIDVPTVVHCKGHRWSASFPVPSLSEEMLDSALGSRKVSLGDDTAMGRGFVNHDKKFAACGDWIAPLGKAGCAEVAVLSGLAVGRALANLQ